MKNFKIPSISLFIVFYLISSCSSKSINDEEKLGPTIKVNDKDVEAIVEDLANLIEELPMESFEGDTVLEQVVDKLNDRSAYKLGGPDKNSLAIYERNSNDLDKDSIVLLPSQDKITVRKAKKTFIGLKQTEEDPSKYYVFHIYIRSIL